MTPPPPAPGWVMIRASGLLGKSSHNTTVPSPSTSERAACVQSQNIRSEPLTKNCLNMLKKYTIPTAKEVVSCDVFLYSEDDETLASRQQNNQGK